MKSRPNRSKASSRSNDGAISSVQLVETNTLELAAIPTSAGEPGLSLIVASPDMLQKRRNTASRRGEPEASVFVTGCVEGTWHAKQSTLALMPPLHPIRAYSWRTQTRRRTIPRAAPENPCPAQVVLKRQYRRKARQTLPLPLVKGVRELHRARSRDQLSPIRLKKHFDAFCGMKTDPSR